MFHLKLDLMALKSLIYVNINFKIYLQLIQKDPKVAVIANLSLYNGLLVFVALFIYL